MSRKQAVLAVALALAASAAGCGGGADGEPEATRTVRGPGFAFTAPSSWSVEETRRSRSASPGGDDPELVSVTAYRLARPYTPELWESVVPELDGVADQLAERLQGTVRTRETVTLAGRRARRYDIAYARGGERLVQRTAFVLDGRRELQLLCRYPDGEAPPACALLFSSLRLA